MDPSAIGMHGMPAGGAIAAAGAGVADHIFKRHGHWRSESAKDGYMSRNMVVCYKVPVYMVPASAVERGGGGGGYTTPGPVAQRGPRDP